MNKLNRILIGVLAVQLVLLVVIWTRGGDVTTVRALEPLLDLDAETISKVQIFDQLEPGTDPAVAISLEKRADDWVLTSHFDYPADATAVSGMIAKLAAMAARAPTTTNAEKHAQLAVAADNYKRKVILGGSGGDTVIYVGTETGFRQTAVRIGDAADVFTVAGLSAGELGVNVPAWIDPVYFELDPARVARMTVESATDTVTLTRNGEAWQLAPAPAADGSEPAQPTAVAADKVKPLLEAATRLSASDIAAAAAAPEHGFSSPTARITLATATDDPAQPQETFVIELGTRSGTDYLVRTLDRKHVVKIAASTLEPLTGIDRAALASATPAPTPTPPVPRRLPPSPGMPVPGAP